MPSIPQKFVEKIVRPNCLSPGDSRPVLCLSTLKTQADSIPENGSHVPPMFESYCVSCHGDNKPKGDLNLEEVLRNGSVADNVKTWQKVIDMLQYEEMPPVEEDQSNRRACRLYLSKIERTRVERPSFWGCE